MSEPSFCSAPMTVAKFWRPKPGPTKLRADTGPPSRALTRDAILLFDAASGRRIAPQSA